MKKFLLSVLFAIPFFSQAQILVEEFDYPAGQLTTVSGGSWVNFSGTGNFIPVVAGSLSYTGYGSSGIGNKIQMVYSTASSEDVRRSFTAITSGSVYLSFLLSVTNTTGLGPNSGSGDYFVSFRNEAGTNTGYKGILYIRQGVTAGTYQLGIKPTTAGSGGAVAFHNTDLTVGTTYLVVMKYQIVAGAANDVVSLFVNPPLTGAEPAPSATSTFNATDSEPDDIDGIALRQNNNSGVGTPNAELDGIRVSSGWFNAPLPVSLLSFGAAAADKRVNVSWSTANELNLSGFEVQRSLNGKDFAPISLVEASGATSKSYSFVDENAVAGLSYYRLKMTDKDGSYKYSIVAPVKIQSIGVSVYPNPVKSVITLQHEAATEGAVIAILDLSGKQAMTLNVQAGAMQSTLNAARLAPGSYLVVFNNNGTRTTKQFIKE